MKMLAVIHPNSINRATGLDVLVKDVHAWELPNVKLMIEVTKSGIDYTPVKEETRKLFPTLNRALVNYIIVLA